MSKVTNKKHLKFIDEYMIDLNGSEAAIRAGYSKKTARSQASRLLTNADIMSEIKDRQAKAAKSSGVSRDEIIADLKRIKDECKAKGEYPPYALKAIEILCKMLGFNEADKSEVTHKGLTVNYIKPKKKKD